MYYVRSFCHSIENWIEYISIGLCFGFIIFLFCYPHFDPSMNFYDVLPFLILTFTILIGIISITWDTIWYNRKNF